MFFLHRPVNAKHSGALGNASVEVAEAVAAVQAVVLQMGAPQGVTAAMTMAMKTMMTF